MQNQTLLDLHAAAIKNQHFQLDSGQVNAAEQLQRLLIEVNMRGDAKGAKNFLSSLFGKPSSVRGMYLWGGVGRGKTHLMDLFFSSVSIEKKRRIHFHRFMQLVHARLKEHRNTSDPLAKIGREFARDCRLLCLDEFFVLDIGDAVILAGLLKSLLSNGVVLVMTSNTYPDQLYRGGIQRDRFVPAIRLIQSSMEIVDIGDGIDYRLKSLSGKSLFFNADDAESNSNLQNGFFSPTDAGIISKGGIEVLGRTIDTVQYTDSSIWFEFDKICDGPRSKADYIEIANVYRTVIISDIPEFTWEYENQARRFIELVDEFYDRGVHLVVSAYSNIDSLYSGKRLVEEFKRTSSRLHEMQTEKYLSKGKSCS